MFFKSKKANINVSHKTKTQRINLNKKVCERKHAGTFVCPNALS
jgi:hypothetical protein